ncbi:MAG: outer membrane lipoprotein LolB [Cellvibrionaceae bacterium]|jgi:outer membrane lipoprotein LolB
MQNNSLKSLRLALSTYVLSILLIGCSQTPFKQVDSVVDVELPPPDVWSIQAKLGIRSEENSGSVTLNWQQEQQQYLIRIQGSLGQGSATIRGNEQYVIIERPGESPLFSNNVDTFIGETFGWDLPISSFKYWVRGLYSPKSSAGTIRYDKSNRITSIEQSGWTLNYSLYQIVDGRLLPGKIRARQGEDQLTLIIRRWRLSD